MIFVVFIDGQLKVLHLNFKLYYQILHLTYWCNLARY